MSQDKIKSGAMNLLQGLLELLNEMTAGTEVEIETEPETDDPVTSSFEIDWYRRQAAILAGQHIELTDGTEFPSEAWYVNVTNRTWQRLEDEASPAMAIKLPWGHGDSFVVMCEGVHTPTSIERIVELMEKA